MRRVGDLSRLHEEYFDLGLRVVAITTELPEEVEEEMLRAREVEYWIGSDPSGRMIELYKDDSLPTPPGARSKVSIPKSYLIDGHGRVVGDAIPTEERIEKLLEGRFDASELPPLHVDLGPARAAYARGAFGEAFESAQVLASSADEALAKDAVLLKERVEAYAEFLQGLAESSLEKKRPGRAYGLSLALVHRFEGTEAARAARAELQELRADPSVRKELDAWRDFEAALERDVKPAGAFKADVIRASYEKVARANAGTWAAWFAEDRAKKLAPR